MTRIPFNVPSVTGREIEYIGEVIRRREFSGNGIFTARCQNWLKERLAVVEALLTHSCTAALEMAAILSELVVRFIQTIPKCDTAFTSKGTFEGTAQEGSD